MLFLQIFNPTSRNSTKCIIQNKILSDKVKKKVMENFSKQIDVLMPIIKERELNFKSCVMGFHLYRKIWEPKSNEILEVKMEPRNKIDKFTVRVIKNKNVYYYFVDKLHRYFK